MKYLSRVIAYLPGLLLTCITGKLQLIFDLTGLAAIFLSFTIPATFVIIARYKFRKNYGKGSDKTPYTCLLL